MNNLTQQLKQGAEHAIESLSDGWRELRARAGEALTRFRSSDNDVREGEDDELPALSRWSFMAADVIEDDDRVVVRLEAPGMRREDFQVELRETILSVRGEKRVDRDTRKGGYRLVQCAYGAFRREIPLPVAVQVDKAKATYRDGVLRIELPKVEGAKAKQISVEVH
jgi:HSP20 family protein